MQSDSLELMFSSDEALTVTHFPPAGDSSDVTALFHEDDSGGIETRETREGQKQNRSGKLVVRDSLTVTCNGEKVSRFRIRGEVWRVVAVVPGSGIKTVAVERVVQSTMTRPGSQGHQ